MLEIVGPLWVIVKMMLEDDEIIEWYKRSATGRSRTEVLANKAGIENIVLSRGWSDIT